MTKTFLRHTFTENIFDIVTTNTDTNPYLYTFSLYENVSFTIVSAETEYIPTRS